MLMTTLFAKVTHGITYPKRGHCFATLIEMPGWQVNLENQGPKGDRETFLTAPHHGPHVNPSALFPGWAED